MYLSNQFLHVIVFIYIEVAFKTEVLHARFLYIGILSRLLRFFGPRSRFIS